MFSILKRCLKGLPGSLTYNKNRVNRAITKADQLSRVQIGKKQEMREEEWHEWVGVGDQVWKMRLLKKCRKLLPYLLSQDLMKPFRRSDKCLR